MENIIPTAASYRMAEDDRSYEECLHSEEQQHADWLEKIKISSAENYKAGDPHPRLLIYDIVTIYECVTYPLIAITIWI